MGNQITKKTTSVILFIAMVLSCLSGVAPVKVEASENARQINYGISGIKNPAEPSNMNLWKGSYVYFGKYNGTSLKWRVLDTTGNGGNSSMTDAVLLQADSTLKDSSNNEKLLPYDGISTWLNDYFLADFTAGEQNALQESSCPAPVSPSVSFLTGAGLNREKVFLLDAEDLATNKYGYTYNADDESFNCGISTKKPWWLRSGYNITPAVPVHGCVLSGGMPLYSFDTEARALVPAMNINTSTILFASATNFNKKTDFNNSGKLQTVDNSEWKLTLLENSYSVTADTVTRSENRASGMSTITVSYSNAAPESGQLSLMITNGTYTSGNILYYGKVNPISSSGSGSFTFTLPADYSDSCKTYLIAEKVNGNNETDYAGTPVLLSIPKKHDHEWSNDWSSDTTYHWHECTINDPSCDIADNDTASKGNYGEHTWGTRTTTTQGTCIVNEKYTETCTICKKIRTSEGNKNPDKHNYIEETPQAATCTTAGYKQKRCTWCNKIESKTTLPALNHNWKKISQKDPTCEAAGLAKYECDRCHSLKEETLSALGHNLTKISQEDPTCEVDGRADYKCTRCDYTETRILTAPGHFMDVILDVPTSCEKSFEKGIGTYGYYIEECIICGAQQRTDYTEEDDVSECEVAEDEDGNIADEDIKDTQEASCTEPGIQLLRCQWCGEWYEDPTEPLGHEFGEWQVVKAPTGEKNGVQERVCSVCGEKEQAEIPKHNYVGAVTTSPSCGITGVMTYTCSDCGDAYTEKIPALTHSYGEWVQTVAPTETTKGEEQRVCSICGDTESRSTDTIQHKHHYQYDVWKSSDTKHWHECSCGQKQDVDTHNWDNGTVTQHPTDEKTGMIQYTCVQCKYQVTHKLPITITTFSSGRFLYEFSGTENGTPNVTLLGFRKKKDTKKLKIPKTITIDNVTYTVNKIGYEAFSGNTGITQITIPNSVTEIEELAFFRTNNVKSVVLGSRVQKIGKHAFCHMRSLETFTIKGNNLKVKNMNFFHGTNDFTVYVPKAKKNAYKKMLSKHKRHTVKVKK